MMQSKIYDIDAKLKEIRSVCAGWILDREGVVLCEYASRVPENGVILEIGSYQGLSTLIFALFSDPTVTIYTIDPHECSAGDNYPFSQKDLDLYYRNLNHFDVGHKVKTICLRSDEVGKIWKKEIDLLFVDGSHAYLDVKQDLLDFVKFVKLSGRVLVHDNNWQAVMDALREVTPGLMELESQVDITNIYRRIL